MNHRNNINAVKNYVAEVLQEKLLSIEKQSGNLVICVYRVETEKSIFFARLRNDHSQITNISTNKADLST